MPIYDNDLYPRSGDAVTVNGRAKITGTPTDANDLMTKSVTETAIADAVALAVSQIRAVSITKRQTAFYGPVDSNGKANFLTISGTGIKLNATTVNVGLTWGAGIDADGPVDRLYIYTADQTPAAWNALGDGTHYLYIDYNSGVPTFGTSSLKPKYQTTTPVTPASGQAWFDISTYNMYVYNGATWVATERLFLGRAIFSAGSPTEIRTWGYNGRYDSGWFAVAASTNYTIYHDNGCDSDIYYEFSLDSAGADHSKAHDVFIDAGNNYVSHWNIEDVANSDSDIYVKFGFITYVQGYRGTGRTSGYYRIIAKRGW